MGLETQRPEGNVYYLTTVVQNRLPLFTRPSFIIPLIDNFNYYRHKLNFKLIGYVIMPDHLHCIAWLCGEATVSDVMRDFKKYSAVRLVRQAEVEGKTAWLEEFKAAGAAHGREHRVWQEGYWDKVLFTKRFLRQKLHYMHRNPLRAGLVDSPEAYPYSSYQNYVEGDDALIEIDKDWL